MATDTEIKKFVMTVAVHFPVPARDDEAEVWMASMTHMLRQADSDVLAAAALHILDTRKPKVDGKWFPTPAECREACVAAKAKLEMAKRTDAPMISHGERDQSPWAGWRIDRADELIRTTAMGRQAAAEGWTLALHDFIRANQRLPNDHELGRVRASSAETREAVERCERGEAGALSGPLARLGRTILERGKDMAAYVGGKGEATWRR